MTDETVDLSRLDAAATVAIPPPVIPGHPDQTMPIDVTVPIVLRDPHPRGMMRGNYYTVPGVRPADGTMVALSVVSIVAVVSLAVLLFVLIH